MAEDLKPHERTGYRAFIVAMSTLALVVAIAIVTVVLLVA